MHPYTIIFECDFPEFWRYNLLVYGEALQSGECCQNISYIDKVAALGSELSAVPLDYKRTKRIEIATVPGDGLQLYIYIMPHTMPFVTEIAAAPPFDFRVIVEASGKQCLKRTYPVNQWSGCNFEITL